jgi:hypothetical protein
MTTETLLQRLNAADEVRVNGQRMIAFSRAPGGGAMLLDADRAGYSFRDEDLAAAERVGVGAYRIAGSLLELFVLERMAP